MGISWSLQLGIWGLLCLVLVSAAIVVVIRNLFRAALSLGLALLGVAGLFILLEAEFLAFVQILVYVGAILTLVVFAVMLTSRADAQAAEAARRAGRAVGHGAAVSRQRGPAAVAAAVLFVLLAFVTQAIASNPAGAPAPVDLPTLGKELVTTLVLPFEVISLIFVAALVGAIAIASTRSSRGPVASRLPRA